MTLSGLKGPPHVGRSNIALPSIYKEFHGLGKFGKFKGLPRLLSTQTCPVGSNEVPDWHWHL